MRLYNTLSRKIEEIIPQKNNSLSFYSCGLTVYDYAHIGHGRKYVNDDILKRTLQYLGFKVNHVMNVTDVGHLVSDGDDGEDKLEKGAKKYSKTVWDIDKFYTEDFLASLKKLNSIPPDTLCKATEHIPQMISLIKTLEEKGFTYNTPEAVYFDTSKFIKYGQLSGQKLEDKIQKARKEVHVDPNKKHPTDFALWFKRIGRFVDHAMHWESPWGDGFPGWHIECSAMSMHYLGETIDIHSGGVDLIPVHHENEIAQSEAATGKQFVRYWFHSNFLMVGGIKMSKSLNNFYTIDDIVKKGFSPIALRYLYLQTHYRQMMNFSEDALSASENALNKLHATVSQLRAQKDENEQSHDLINTFRSSFKSALEDDLQMSQALAVMYDMLKSNISSSDKLNLLYEFDDVLGLGLRDTEDVIIPKEITELANRRQKAKESKDYSASDILRDRIVSGGYSIEDTSEGFIIRKA